MPTLNIPTPGGKNAPATLRRATRVGPRTLPVVFNAAMVRAILAGDKTQTRRPIKPVPASDAEVPAVCRAADAGGVLWVREGWNFAPDGTRIYQGDVSHDEAKATKWKSGRFMPRSAARLYLDVLEVRPERLSACGEDDARAEGMPPGLFDEAPDAGRVWFRRLWDAVYGKTEFAWQADPWVWVIRFRPAS